MSITYTPTTNFGAKDSLPANDSNKVVKGAEFTTEFAAIQSAFALAAPSSNPTFTGTATFDGLNVTSHFTSVGIDDNANATAITIDSNENVGIGSEALTTTTRLTVDQSTSGAAWGLNGIAVTNGTRYGGFGYNGTALYVSAGDASTLDSELAFATASGGAEAERMRIDATGNVGIGTDTPAERLHTVVGSTRTVRIDASYAFGQRNAAITIKNTLGPTTTGDGYISQGVAAGGVGLYQGGTYSGGGNNQLRDGASTFSAIQLDGGAIRFQAAAGETVNGSIGDREKMRLESDGNLGIGIPSPSAKLDVITDMRLSSGIASKYMDWSITATGNYKASTVLTDEGLEWSNNSSGRGFVWSNGSGELARIDSSGNLGIGTPAPVATAKLSISDASNAAISIDNTSGRAYELISTSTGLFGLLDRDAATYRMVFDSTGDAYLGAATGSGFNGRLVVSDAAVGGQTFIDIANGSNNNQFLKLGISNNNGIIAVDDGDDLIFGQMTDASQTGLSAEFGRFDNLGNLLVGATAVGGGQTTAGHLLGLNPAGVGQHRVGKTATGTYSMLAYYHNGTYVGGLNVSDTGVAIIPSSDARLKDNIVDAPAGNIDDLKVRSYDWKSTGEHVTYGLVAQEVHEAAPQSAIYNEEEDQWGVDYASLVPLLIKEIQDLKAEVEALKNA